MILGITISTNIIFVKVGASLSDVYNKLTELYSSQKELQSEIRVLKVTLCDFQTQCNILSEKNMNLRNDNQILERRCSQLENGFEYYRQKTLDCDLEVWGIDKTPDERLAGYRN